MQARYVSFLWRKNWFHFDDLIENTKQGTLTWFYNYALLLEPSKWNAFFTVSTKNCKRTFTRLSKTNESFPCTFLFRSLVPQYHESLTIYHVVMISHFHHPSTECNWDTTSLYCPIKSFCLYGGTNTATFNCPFFFTHHYLIYFFIIFFNALFVIFIWGFCGFSTNSLKSMSLSVRFLVWSCGKKETIIQSITTQVSNR